MKDYDRQAAQLRIPPAKGAHVMDFIEQWAHVSPDAGSGALEALYVLVAVAIAATAVFRLAVARRNARRRSASSESPR